MRRAIDLTSPNLGADLLKDAKGDLPIDVWDMYFWGFSEDWRPVLGWWVDPSDPEIAPIDPQRAVDETELLVAEVIGHLMSDSPAKALAAARKAIGILVNASSVYQRKRGQSASMRHVAVRAYIIRRFNPHPKRAGKFSVSWAELADKLFLQDGKCPRKIRDKRVTRICGLRRHQYNSFCVKALRTAVDHLKAAMKHDGIPV
jgi:hypothetical protein